MDWTESNVENFLSKIRFDFITQIDKKIDALEGFTQADLAKKLNTTEGYVSQVLNNPPNLTLRSIVNFARAVGLKVAIVAYDDNDPDNNRGLVNAEIFSSCWEKQGRPIDFFDLDEIDEIETVQNNVIEGVWGDEPVINPEIDENNAYLLDAAIACFGTRDDNTKVIEQAPETQLRLSAKAC
jgi:transcriptional regulator with XRE-family HTH domain